MTAESKLGKGTKGWSKDDTSAAKKNKPQASNIFGAKPTAPAAAEPGVPENATEAQLLEIMKTKLAKRGTRGISSIAKKFKIADDNRSGHLDF